MDVVLVISVRAIPGIPERIFFLPERHKLKICINKKNNLLLIIYTTGQGVSYPSSTAPVPVRALMATIIYNVYLKY